MRNIKGIDDGILDGEKYKKNLEYIKTLTSIYFSTHVLNLNEDTVEEILTNEEIEQKVNSTEHASYQMQEIMKYTITDEYLEDALNFTNLKTLNERMKGKKIISADFIGKFNGWTRFHFIANSYDEKGDLVTALFLSRIIDQEKKAELELIKHSYTDALTGINNRRAFSNDLQAALANKEDIYIFAFDINGLKKVNDILGHHAGDELIVAAAKIISEYFSGIGKTYRTGGDEFSAIMHGKYKNADLMINELNEEISKWSGKINKSLSISIGVASFAECKDSSDKNAILAIADARMYENKKKYYSSKF